MFADPSRFCQPVNDVGPVGRWAARTRTPRQTAGKTTLRGNIAHSAVLRNLHVPLSMPALSGHVDGADSIDQPTQFIVWSRIVGELMIGVVRIPHAPSIPYAPSARARLFNTTHLRAAIPNLYRPSHMRFGWQNDYQRSTGQPSSITKYQVEPLTGAQCPSSSPRVATMPTEPQVTVALGPLPTHSAVTPTPP